MKPIPFFKNLSHCLRMICKDYPHAIAVMIIYAFSGAAIPYWNIFFSAQILSSLLAADYRKAIIKTLILVGGTFVLGILYKVSETHKHIYQWTVDEAISGQVMDKAFVMEYDVFETTESMDRFRTAHNKVSFNGGVNAIWWGINECLLSAFGTLFSFVFLVQLLWTSQAASRISDLLLWAVIGCLIIVVFLNAYYSKKNYAKYEKIQKDEMHENAVWSYIQSLCMSVPLKKDVMLYDMDTVAEKYLDSQEYVKKMDVWDRYASRFNSVYSILTNGYTALCYIYVCIRAAAGTLPISDVLLHAGSLQRLSTNLTELIANYTELAHNLDLLNGYYDYIHQPPMHYTGTLPIEKRKDADYELEFRNVSFVYPGTDQYVLKNINLKFKVGQKLALVGRNGAGKTTIVKLLCRLYEPTEGEILLNGISIWKYDYAEYTKIYAPVFQDFKLFSLPVAENIASAVEYDEDRIRKALRKAGIWERVEQMKDGIHTQLYHNNGDGVEISGGEAQKLAIARAWYKDAPFIILDEPTAALDPLAEAEIYENFNSLIENKTAIYISHRMSSCKFCDTIVVMKDGKIEEQGTHAELLTRNGEYAALYNAQAAYYQ